MHVLSLLAFSFRIFAIATLGLIAFIRRHRSHHVRTSSKNVFFFHPDLGIGGAERLVIDAVMGLSEFHECKSTIVTTNLDPSRCFDEVKPKLQDKNMNDDDDFNLTRPNGRVVNINPEVIVCGQNMPRAIQGRFVRLCKTLSMTWALVWTAYSCPSVDAIIIDQLAFAVLIARLLFGSKVPIAFYCHFPDVFCDPNQAFHEARWRKSLMHEIYAWVFNFAERQSLFFANSILYNSEFTKSVSESFFGTHTCLRSDVVYPAVQHYWGAPTLEINESTCGTIAGFEGYRAIPKIFLKRSPATFLIVSISRFEPKKNQVLALSMLEEIVKIQEMAMKLGLRAKNVRVHLILAGGYDHRLADNRDCMKSIQQMISGPIAHMVSILPNMSNDLKWGILQRADAVAFTPLNEHFGIVPVEAMLCGKPVVATCTGGLLETIGQSQQYGILTENDPKSFALAMLDLMEDHKKREEIGRNAKKRAETLFSMEELAMNLYSHIF